MTPHENLAALLVDQARLNLSRAAQGSKDCGCGARISANKAACRACVERITAEGLERA